MPSRRRAQEEPMDLDVSILDSLYNAAKLIKNTTEKKKLQTVLFSSINDSRGVADAALHIAYQMTGLKQRVLLINLDAASRDHFLKYLEVEDGARLLKTLQNSNYLSESIESTQYEELNYIGTEDAMDDEVVNILNEHNLAKRLGPLKNYYDRIIIAGPEYETFSKYSNILELADSAVTISKNKTSDYRKLQKYLNELELFNIHSLGVIRHE